MPSIQDLIQVLQRETGFERLFSLFREKYRSYERVGQSVKVTLRSPTTDEQQALEGFFGESFKGAKTITISTTKFQKAINKTVFKDAFEGYDMNDVVMMYYNGQLTSKKQEKECFSHEKDQFFQSIIERSIPDSSFYRFLLFIREHDTAARVHTLYKSNAQRLGQWLEVVASLFARLPMHEDVFLPMLAYELTGDSQALNPSADGGKMVLYALQVIDHIDHGTDIMEKLTDDQMADVFGRHRILYRPDINGEMKRKLYIYDEDEASEKTHSEELIVLEKIGAGSFAKVFRIHDVSLNKEMACKILFDKNHFRQIYGKDGDEYLQRFIREVRVLKKELDHPNVITLDKVQLQKAPFCFTMPVADCSLESWVEDNQDTTEEMRLHLFKQILTGVKYLHDQKIYHRDLAPNNILLFKSTDGSLRARIADFGLVKDHRSLSVLTRNSINGYGRGGFTAPEQMKSLAESDHLSDIYSLGALLYYVLSGQLPERRFASPTNYSFIVAKAMEDERCKRYQTISEFMKDLDESVLRRLSYGQVMFSNLIEYKQKDSTIDIHYVLECLSKARIEQPDHVYDLFVKPFLSIPSEVLALCCKYEISMIPFVEIFGRNLGNLHFHTMVLTQSDWEQIIRRIEILFLNAEDRGLKLSIIKMTLNCAFVFQVSFAHQLIGRMFEALPLDDGIAEEIAHNIEKDYLSYHEELIQILEGREYPTPIRFALNDF